MANAKKTVTPEVTKTVIVTPAKTTITLELTQDEADALFLVLGMVNGTSEAPFEVYSALENLVSDHDNCFGLRNCGNLKRTYNGFTRIDKK